MTELSKQIAERKKELKVKNPEMFDKWFNNVVTKLTKIYTDMENGFDPTDIEDDSIELQILLALVKIYNNGDINSLVYNEDGDAVGVSDDIPFNKIDILTGNRRRKRI